MKKPEIIINKFSFYDLTKKGLKLLIKKRSKQAPGLIILLKKKKLI